MTRRWDHTSRKARLLAIEGLRDDAALLRDHAHIDHVIEAYGDAEFLESVADAYEELRRVLLRVELVPRGCIRLVELGDRADGGDPYEPVWGLR